MPKCGGTLECTEDAITLDDLESEECVAFHETPEENSCVSCDTVKSIQTSNKKAFDTDPIEKIFGKRATRSQTAKMRELLKNNCNIESKEPAVEQLQKIYVFDESKIASFVAKISAKLNAKQNKKYKKYLTLLITTLAKTKQWNALIENNSVISEEVLKDIMKRDLLTLITDLRITNIGFAHNPRNIIMAAYGFLERASEASHTKLSLALLKLSDSTACYEGVLGLAENVLYE
jgi:hypothetical protein